MLNTVRHRTIACVFAAASLLPSAALGTSTPAPDASGQLVNALIGRWAGNGEAVFKDGKHELFKCVVTYFTDKAGDKVKQSLRCNSERLDLSLESNWQVSAGSITGTWRETKYELKGTLLGSMDPEGYNLYAENEFANATISVRTSACQQDVVMKFSKEGNYITPQ